MDQKVLELGISQTISLDFPDLVEKLRVCTGFSLVPAEKMASYYPQPPEGSQDVLLPEGRIFFCDQFQVTYRFRAEGRLAVYAPSHTSALINGTWHSGHYHGQLQEVVLDQFPSYILELGEDVVSLPIPKWFRGDAEPGYMFVSQAKKEWAEFVAQNPFE